MSPRWNNAALAGVVAGAAALAWWQRSLVDDAFISFRYARHLAEGHGLVWNVGEAPIEGFTNFLWTVLLAGFMRLGIGPEAASQALGVACLCGTLAFTYLLARRWMESAGAALVVVALVGLNPTVSAFATSGLETSAQAMLFTACMALLAAPHAERRRARLAALGLSAALATALRIDSAVLVLVVLASIGALARRALAVTGLSAAAVLLPWAVVRLATFHALLPNTYLAKVAGDTPAWGRGATYLVAFGLLHAALPLGALAVGSFLRSREATVAPAVALCAAWTLYVAWVGGDFMEFRFMTPVIPTGIALLGRAVEREIAQRAARVAVALGLAGVFLVVYRVTRVDSFFSPSLKAETVHALARHLDHPDEDWRGIGRRLHQAFAPDSGVTLAVTAAGAIPYESGLRTIDMYGLNDRWIAEHGKIVASRASGHRRVATVPYLMERGAHLVVCTSTIWTRGEPRTAYSLAEARRTFLEAVGGRIPDGARVIEVPLDHDRAFRMLSLKPHPAVEARLQDPGWRVFAINRQRMSNEQ